jgi:hypothetical protein
MAIRLSARTDDDGHRAEPKLPRRSQAPMTSDHVPILADEDGIGEAEGAENLAQERAPIPLRSLEPVH